MTRSNCWIYCFCAFSIALIGCDDDSPSNGGDDVGVDIDDGIEPDAGPGQGCAANDDCADSEYCDLGANDDEGTCEAGCRVQSDNCTGGQVCNPSSHTCRDECRRDSDCTNAGCVDGSCDPDACLLDGSTCSDDERCDRESRRCVDRTVACCMDDGSCSLGSGGECDGSGGIRRGTSCEPNPCRQPPDCEADDDCEDDEYCTNAGECNGGCRQDPDNCDADDEACGPDHECAERDCDNDGDCPGDLYCLQPFGTCYGACDGDDDCPDGVHCDANRCARGCVDNGDAEDNDEQAEANALEFDEDGMASDDDGRLCPLDPDWFAVTLDAPGRLRIELACEGDDDPDLGIELFDADGRLAGANDEGCAQTLEWPGDEDSSTEGEFFISVSGGAPDEGSDYDLTVTVLDPGGLCEADAGEDDDEPADALFIDESDAQIDGRTVCADDADWFSLQLADGDGIAIELTVRGDDALTFDLVGPGIPDPDFDPDDPLVLRPMELAEDGTLRAELALNNQLIVGGAWYLRVRGELEGFEGEYDLHVTVTRVDDACDPDDSEINDGSDAATDLMAVDGFADGDLLAADQELTVEGRSLCANDADWYRVVLAEGDQLSARVTVFDEAGDPAEADDVINVAVVNAGGASQGPAGTFTGPEIIGRSGRLPAAGEYFVRVTGPGVTNGYDLTLVRRAARAECLDDRFENAGRNDGRESADPLVLGDQALAVADLNLCNSDAPGGDADWFTFDLDAEGRLQVDLTFASADGDIDLEVFRGEERIGTGDSGDDNETVAVDAGPGTYYVVVSSFFGAENTYDLRIEHTERVECDPDQLEDNDHQGEATGADVGLDEDVWICQFPDDEDWYELTAPPGESRTFHVDFLRNDDGWLTVDAHDQNGVYVDTSDRNVNGQCIVVDATDEGSTWYFAVSARSFQRRDATPDRVAYRVRVADGDECGAFEPLLADEWLHLP